MVQVKEVGKSECPFVMKGIRFQDLTYSKEGRLPTGASMQGNCNKIFNSGKQMSCKNILFEQCAPETEAVLWTFINWGKVKQQVKSLQQRTERKRAHEYLKK